MTRLLVVALAVLGCATAEQPSSPLLRVVLISDLNAPYGSTQYPAEVSHAVHHITTTWRPDLVLIAGDMIAGQQPTLPDTQVRAMWSAFDSVVAAPLRAAGIPLIATLGNHDASAYPAQARDRRLAVEYWLARETSNIRFVERDDYPLRYAVRYGDVFVAAWDGTNEESSTNAELVDWLHDVLHSPAAQSARHRIVLSHLPLYGIAVGRDRRGEVLADGDRLRRQLEEWGATLFISGHHHAWYPGRVGSLELLHSGAIGDGPRQLVGTDIPAQKALALLEFHRDSLSITAYAIDSDGRLSEIPLRALPPVICATTGRVVRIDVAPSAAMCE